MQAYVQPLCPFAVPNLWGASELNLATASLETVQRALVLNTVERPDMVCALKTSQVSQDGIGNKMHDRIHIETINYDVFFTSTSSEGFSSDNNIVTPTKMRAAPTSHWTEKGSWKMKYERRAVSRRLAAVLRRLASAATPARARLRV